jgi:hypothetical protein
VPFLPLAALLAAVLLALPRPSHGAGETIIRDLHNTKIIRSNEQPHNILVEACVACHPKEKYDFWLIIYKDRPPSLTVDLPEARPVAAAEPARPGNKYNSHDVIGCSFCHFENPTANAPRFVVDVPELCALCHPGVEPHHLPEGEGLERVREAIRAGKIPGKDGSFLCTTCHQVHRSTYGIRQAYVRTLQGTKIPNPHGDRTLCFSCHPGEIKEGAPAPRPKDRDDVTLCNDCHLQPGVKRSPHAVGAGISESTWRMEYLGYPLSDGKLTCVTCHDEVSHRKPDPANPKFLRGGPYANQDQFCYRCHLEDRERLDNPHRQIDAFGKIRAESCKFCHATPPDPTRRPGDPANLAMVGPDKQICSNCHEDRPHPDRDHMVPFPERMMKRKVEYEKRHQVVLPLADDGTVKCSTCHNPHAKGVLKGELGVGAGSKYRVPDFREVCAPCHGRF